MTDFVVVPDESSVVIVQEIGTQQVEVIAQGPAGARGEKGEKGDVGDVNPQMPILLASTELARDEAVTAQVAAESAKVSAESSATTATAQALVATTKANDASASATSASTSAQSASASADAAMGSQNSASDAASSAASSASQAASSASQAANSASSAATSATSATTSATNATNSASAAATSATNAASSAGSASTSATNAANSATAAGSSATTASNQATVATTKASEAATSASAASTSATNAATSATAAQASATNAAASATNASNSASAASSSAGSASTSATNAAASATAAATSASNANTSASNASASATNAATSATTAQNWAIQTDGPVSGGEYSAKWWANEASNIVTAGVIDDASTGFGKTWSSAKISTELSGKQPADATILKSADIGVTVQSYNANTVIDASYVHTDNNYTTTEKNKLAGIAAGAEVNVNADWNAISGDAQILNKPTLGTAAAANTTDFATAAQGAKADTALQPAAIGVSLQAYDADLTSIAGLTGTSGLLKKTAANTWSLDTSTYLTSYTETDPVFSASAAAGITTTNIGNWNTAYGWGNHATAGYLDNADIGTTVQGYNANTVIDAAYVHTDNNYTTAEKTKLSGIAAGAEVNVNADWNAVSGDAQILNKPTLGTAAAANTTDFATAAQGAKADTALQPAAIGTTVQAYDADLTSWAGIAPSAKQDTLVSGTNIKTINSQSLLGSGDIVISGGGSSALTIDNKTAAYTVVAGDLGKIINCTSGTFTVSLTAAATLGAGFNCWIWNTSVTETHVITVNPNASETIDGVLDLKLRCGEGLQIVCDGTNWQTGDKKVMRGYAENLLNISTRPVASGSISTALGSQSSATGNYSVAIGNFLTTTASGNGSLAIQAATAGSGSSTAIGVNSNAQGATTATGSGAMALGGSYASGTDSFAAAIANNTSSYGATGANSVAIGQLVNASSLNAVALGWGCLASGANSVAAGSGNTASGTYSGSLFGNGCTASGYYSSASGGYAVSNKYGKQTFASGRFAVSGDAQTGVMVLRQQTTDNIAVILTSNGVDAAATNQVVLPNNSTYTFRVQVVGMQQAAGGTNTAGYTFEGVIRRGANAAATVLKNSVKTVLHEDDASWDCNVSADTTNGGLAVTVTGAAATNIRWVAVVTTAEVTYA